MQEKTASDKPNYHAHLLSIAKDVYKDVVRYDTDEADVAINAIAVALIDVGRESWKNGIEAGRRKASKPAGSTKQS